MSVAKKIKENKNNSPKMGLLVENPVYKPFRYPWCYDSWLTQQRYFKELTDMDLREKLYGDKMKELEQDLVPFGFIAAKIPKAVPKITATNKELNDNNIVVGRCCINNVVTGSL